MPFTVERLGDIRRTIDIPFDGEILKVTYKLSAINSDLSDWLREHGRDRNSLMDYLSKVVVWWDIVANNEPVAPTRENMERYKFPTALLKMMERMIDEDADEKNLHKSWSGGSPTD